jgi:hypothetical protein
MKHKNYFSVQQLRTRNLIKSVESISVIAAAIIINMLAPQLLIRYVYDPSTLIAPPPVFEYLPLVTYSIAVIYFLVAMTGNFLRERKARKLEREMILYSGCCSEANCKCGHENSDDDITDEELKELERIVDEALKPEKKTTKRKPAKKKAVKKRTKKTK